MKARLAPDSRARRAHHAGRSVRRNLGIEDGTLGEDDPDRERILGTVPATLHRGGDLRAAAPDCDVGPPRRAIR